MTIRKKKSGSGTGTKAWPVFIPTTREVSIGDGVVYRPIRSWHSGTCAGEGHLHMPHGDRSGCIDDDGKTSPPHTVTHRLYWNVSNPKDTISAFLSYPNAMGLVDEYFWEAIVGDDVERWIGGTAEADMEQFILGLLGDSAKASAEAEAARVAREERPEKIAEAKQVLRDAAAALRGEPDTSDPFDLN
jgi:hypothetical protein